jgi:zinc transport system ATP-binding protein
MTERNEVVSFQGVSFGYNGLQVFDGVNLSVVDGEFACIVGPNGSGKTTLVKLILGLLRQDKGEIRLFGKNPAGCRERVGYMPQQVHLDKRFPVTVREVVLMGRVTRGWAGLFTRKDKQIADRVLQETGLFDVRGEPFSEISGGQQRRLLIARALAGEPELLLLDEPTANLDLVIQEELYRLLRDLNQRLTIIMVSHDMAFVSQFVNKVICVNRNIAVHKTGEINAQMISELFGSDLVMVRHDHPFEAKGDHQ